MSNPNPSPGTRFGEPGGNPRHHGAWKKESTPRYKLEKMMALSEAELKAVAEDKDAPYFERKLAGAIKRGEWKVIREMIDQVYGLPSATHQHTGDLFTGLADLIAGADKVLEEHGESE